MAEPEKGQGGRADEHEQDGLGRDAAHGGGRDDVSGGSYGRSTGRAGDDLSASSDAGSAGERDAGARRRGLEGKGFDAGTGYGGGGSASAYRRPGGYGGEAGAGGAGGAHIPHGTDEGSEPDDDLDVSRRASGAEDALDPDALPEVRRRDPMR